MTRLETKAGGSSSLRKLSGNGNRLAGGLFALTVCLILLGSANAQESPQRRTFFRFTAEETSQIPGWSKKAAVSSDKSSAVSAAPSTDDESKAARHVNARPAAPLKSAPITPENAIRPASALLAAPLSSIIDDSADERAYDISDRPTVGSETLDDVWRIALDSSRSLQSKDYDYAKAERDIRAAQGVGLPKLSNASGRHSFSEQYAITGSVAVPLLGVSLPFETNVLEKDFTTSITALTIPVYMGGRVRGMIEAANAAASAIAAGKQISALDLKYEVAQTYFLVFRVRKLLEVAKEAEKTIAGHEHDARRLFENGLVTKNVVLSAEVALANARQDVIKAQNAAALSEAAFNRLLWRPLETPVDISDMAIPDLSGDLDGLTALATTRRPELTALAYKSRALAAESKVKRADRLPQVAVVGSHNYLENNNLNTDSSFSGHIGVVWMPIDGGVSRARQQAADFEALSVTKQYEDAQTAIALQVYQAWLDESESRGRVEVARKAVEQANENLRVTTRGFQEGTINHTEVLDATAMWTQAQSNLANARYDAILSTFSLRRATGDL